MEKKPRKLLFSLSKAKGDFVVTPYKGSGKGGQKRNKTMSCCRISHPASGAVAECCDERSFEANKKKAFKRLLEKPDFVSWHKIATAKHMGRIAGVEEWVEKEMKKVKVEVIKDGNWVVVEQPGVPV